MVVNRKPTGRAVGIPAGLAMGTMVSLGITILGAGILAKLLEAELLAQDHTGYAIMVLLFVAAWTGGMTAAGKTKRLRLMISLSTAGIYFMCLLAATALFFGGKYRGVGETGLLILGGGMVAAITNRGKKHTGRRRKKAGRDW